MVASTFELAQETPLRVRYIRRTEPEDDKTVYPT